MTIITSPNKINKILKNFIKGTKIITFNTEKITDTKGRLKRMEKVIKT